MMRWGTTVSYTLRAARRGLARAPWLHVMTLTTITACALLAMTVTLGWCNIHELAQARAQRAASEPIVVTWMPSAGPERVASQQRLLRELRSLPEVARVERTPPRRPGGVQGLEVYVRADAEPAFSGRLARYLEGRAGVRDATVWELAGGGVDVRAIALGLVVFAILAAWLMIGSVLRLIVLARRGELLVLERLGATRRFLRAPHTVLAVGYCLLAALLAAAALHALHIVFAAEWSALMSEVFGVAHDPRFFSPEELVAIFGVAVALGCWSARAGVAQALRR